MLKKVGIGCGAIVGLFVLLVIIGTFIGPVEEETTEVTVAPTTVAAPPDTPEPEPTPTRVPTPTLLPPTTTAAPIASELEVHFVDVGQGDSILILTGDKVALIDGGDSGSELVIISICHRERRSHRGTGRNSIEAQPFLVARDQLNHKLSGVVEYLQDQGIGRIDLMIATHPYPDHIGGLVDVLQAIPVTKVVTNGQPHTTRTFERFLDAIFDGRAEYVEVVRGDTLELGDLALEALHPTSPEGTNLNNQSVVFRLAHGDIGFIFTGDAEQETEESIVASGLPLNAQILKVGHHGSRTSTTPVLLQAVQSEVAIYCAGEDNDYGHPHTETIDALTGIGAEIYGTDVHGTIIVTSDGSRYSISTIGRPRAPPEVIQPDSTECIDINRASREDLMLIIHIGEERVDELISLRPYRSVDGLSRITGIGPARIRDIKEQGLACVP